MSARKLGDIVAAEIEAMRLRAEAGATDGPIAPEPGQWMRCTGEPKACTGLLCLVATVHDGFAHVIHPIRPFEDRPNRIQVRFCNLEPIAEIESINLEAEGWTRDLMEEAVEWSMDEWARTVLQVFLRATPHELG